MIDFNNKIVCITGANGCIGLGLINYFKQLVDSGVKVTVWATSKHRYPKYMDKLYKEGWLHFFQCSMENRNWDVFLSHRAKFDYIFHLAGSAVPSVFTQTPYHTFNLHVDGTRKVIELAGLTNAQIFYASSSEIYGDNPKVPTAEHEEVGKVDPNHPRACYIMGKVAAENYILMCNKEFGTNHKIGRIALCYGPGIPLNDSRILPTLIRRGLEEGKVYLGDGGLSERTYIYIDDCVKKMMNIMKGQQTIYNIGGTETYTILNIARKISSILNVPFDIPPQINSNQKGSPNTVKLADWQYNDEFGPTDAPVNFKDGITNMINFYKSQEVWEKTLV